MRKTVSRAAAVACAAAATVALTTSPAHALMSAGGGSCGYSQTCAAYAQSVPRVGTGSDAEVSCTAYTPYDVQATIVKCYIVGNTGDVHWAPETVMTGRVATLRHRFDAWRLRSNVYNVCTAGGIFTNTYHGPVNYRCGTAI